ncbi:unnamed protein product, partial [Owenia fusiformis]
IDYLSEKGDDIYNWSNMTLSESTCINKCRTTIGCKHIIYNHTANLCGMSSERPEDFSDFLLLNLAGISLTDIYCDTCQNGDIKPRTQNGLKYLHCVDDIL